MAKRGRKTFEYDADLAKEICTRISNGERIKQILASDERFPGFDVWCRWKRENTELNDLYARSIQDKAESVDDEIEEVMHQLKIGKLDPAQARVLIDTLKWKAAKYYPKMFGDKQQIDHTTNGKDIQSEPVKIVFKK